MEAEETVFDVEVAEAVTTVGTGVGHPTLEQALQSEVDVFLRRGWGDTSWRRELDRVRPIGDQRLLHLVHAVAGIEDDAFYMQVKLRAAGVLRSPAIQQFNAVWLTEESDHGRAFHALAERLDPTGQARPAIAHGTIGRDRRAIVALSSMKVASALRRGMLGGYLVRGAMVEHVALTVYRSLLRGLQREGEVAGAAIVRKIVGQEGRHLRFFSHSAHAVLEDHPVTAMLVRRATELTWRPPGVDLYGRDAWRELLLPALRDPVATRELMTVDTKIGRLPGFEGTTIVRRYLERLT